MYKYKPIDFWDEIVSVELVDHFDNDYQTRMKETIFRSQDEKEKRYQKWCDSNPELTQEIIEKGESYNEYLKGEFPKGFCLICKYEGFDRCSEDQYCCWVKHNKGLQHKPDKYSLEKKYSHSCDYFEYKDWVFNNKEKIERHVFIWLLLEHLLVQVKPPQKKEIMKKNPPFNWAPLVKKPLFDL